MGRPERVCHPGETAALSLTSLAILPADLLLPADDSSQLLPNRSITVPLMVVPLATGPLAIPRISLVPVADAVSAFDPSATSFRVSIRSADNMPQAGGQAGDGGRYVFVMPAHPSSATTAAS